MALTADDGDRDLLAAAQRGEREALDAFVRRHDRWVRGIVYANGGAGSGLDDIVQHVWATVWRQLGTLVDLNCWRGWLYRLAKNAAVDAGQRATRQRRRFAALNDGDGIRAAELPPDQHVARSEEHSRVLAAISGLPVIYREPFVLRHMQDWSYADIAEALGLPVDTVETRLVRARRLLRSTLQGEDAAAGR